MMGCMPRSSVFYPTGGMQVLPPPHDRPDDDRPPTALVAPFPAFNCFLAVRNFCGVMGMAS